MAWEVYFSETNAKVPMTSASRPSLIKPPRYHLPIPSPVPEFPVITPDKAVQTLLKPDIAQRRIENATIEDLRPVIAMFLERCPDRKEFGSLIFRNVVVHRADLRDFKITRNLHFTYAYFLNGLDLRETTIDSLSIFGHYVKGILGLVHVKKCREISIQNCQIDGIHCYGAEIDRFHLFGVRLGNSLTIADAKKIDSIICESNCDFYTGIFLQNLSLKDIRFDALEAGNLIQFRGVNAESEIVISDSRINADIEFHSSYCDNFSLTSSTLRGQCDARNSDFKSFNVAKTSLGGRLLLNVDQIRRSRVGMRDRLRSKWDLQTTIDGQDVQDGSIRREVSEQLVILRENFRRFPSLWREEDYCAYRLMEEYRRLQGNNLISFVWKHGFGHLLLPGRVVRTIFVVIISFALIYTFWPYGAVVQTDPSMGAPSPLWDSLYFSVITFTTVGFGDVHPTGWMRVFAMIEGLAGVFLMAVFVLSMARRILRW